MGVMLCCEPGRVAIVTLDRPPANALNRGFFDELLALLDRLASPDVRAVVVTGTGRFFSAGLDLFEVFAYPPAAFDEFTGRFDAGFTRLFAFPKPIVAAVNGHAIAGGAALAAAEELATRPPTAFAATKTSLRADALRHLHAVVATGDPTWDVWRTAETRAAVDAYRERTLRKR